MRALLLVLAACNPDPGKAPLDSAAPTGAQAIVDPARATHYLDLPFPSDDLLTADGTPDLSGFPGGGEGIGQQVVAGWVRRIESTSHGFANHGAAYFRFTEALSGVPAETDGTAADPVLLVDLETGELLPLLTRFVADPQGDIWYGENTLAMAPALGHPPRSGATLAAVVMASAGARPADGWSVPAEVQAGLDRAGVDGEVAVATVFTVQDATAELRAVRDDILARLGDSPDWGDPTLRRVETLSYAQGQTPGGNDATVCTVTFTDGSSEERYLASLEGAEAHSHDMIDGWPMAVYQVEIPVPNYSRLDDRPYMNPGFGHVSDVDRDSGWWVFEGGTPGAPDTEVISVSVSIPEDAEGNPLTDAPVIIYDHGTGGHAYNAVQRRSGRDDGLGLAQVLADAGWAIVSRDSPLYGTRYPLIDEGYGASLGFYNVVNLPAFRDNQRQAAVEGVVMRRFVQTGLNPLLPEGSVDGGRLRRMGHSLGSVTTNLGVAADPDAYEASFLSGAGGVFSHYFLDTGLLGVIDPGLISSLFALLGAEAPDVITTPAVLGAAIGLPEPAWAQVDRLHPVVGLFQWTMDPSDPMTVARDVTVPTTMLVGIGDYQVPNFTSWALIEALPDATYTDVEASYEYDPHWVLHRESAGAQVLADWLAE